MALDEPKDTDNSYDVNGFKFIMDKEFEKIQLVGCQVGVMIFYW